MFRATCDKRRDNVAARHPTHSKPGIPKCPPASPICTKPDRANPLHPTPRASGSSHPITTALPSARPNPCGTGRVLDPVAGRALQFRRCSHPAIDARRAQCPRQPEPGRACLYRSPRRAPAGQRSSPGPHGDPDTTAARTPRRCRHPIRTQRPNVHAHPGRYSYADVSLGPPSTSLALPARTHS